LASGADDPGSNPGGAILFLSFPTGLKTPPIMRIMERSYLDDVKKKYEPLCKKYKIPSFDELNKEFEIEKVQEHETDYLLREVRKTISEKMSAFLRFFETILNPVMAPVFVIAALKNLENGEKQKIKEIYEAMVSVEIGTIELDVEYSEKKEAEFIIKAVKKWKAIKPEILEIMKIIEKSHSISDKKGNSYLG
jgi:hypothetical protein